MNNKMVIVNLILGMTVAVVFLTTVMASESITVEPKTCEVTYHMILGEQKIDALNDCARVWSNVARDGLRLKIYVATRVVSDEWHVVRLDAQGTELLGVYTTPSGTDDIKLWALPDAVVLADSGQKVMFVRRDSWETNATDFLPLDYSGTQPAIDAEGAFTLTRSGETILKARDFADFKTWQ